LSRIGRNHARHSVIVAIDLSGGARATGGTESARWRSMIPLGKGDAAPDIFNSREKMKILAYSP